MKTKNYISIALIGISLFTANISHAAFAIKKDAAKTETASKSEAPHALTAPEATTVAGSNAAAVTTVSHAVVKKHTFFSKLISKIKKAEDAAIPEVLYIILALLGLGWLGMGINDSFGDFDWVISLILYIIFYLPGLIYTLIKIRKYY